MRLHEDLVLVLAVWVPLTACKTLCATTASKQ